MKIKNCNICSKLFTGEGIVCPSCVKTIMKLGNTFTPSTIKVPKTGSDAKQAKSEIEIVSRNTFDPKSLYPYGETPTQQKIKDILSEMTNLLLYKNQKYGDSALNPKKIFYKGDSTNSILIRLDDKIGRVMSNTEEKPRVNDVCDIIGYCTLLLISMGVTAEDIEKFKD